MFPISFIFSLIIPNEGEKKKNRNQIEGHIKILKPGIIKKNEENHNYDSWQ